MTKDHAVNNCQARVKKLACIITIGTLQSTLTAALDMILGLPPLHIFVKAEAPHH
jgi:hypothetical protein